MLWRVSCRLIGWDTTSVWDQISSTTTQNADRPYAESTDREDEWYESQAAICSDTYCMFCGSFEQQPAAHCRPSCRHSEFAVEESNGGFTLFLVHCRLWRFRSTISANRKQLEEISEHLPGPFASECRFRRNFYP